MVLAFPASVVFFQKSSTTKPVCVASSSPQSCTEKGRHDPELSVVPSKQRWCASRKARSVHSAFPDYQLRSYLLCDQRLHRAFPITVAKAIAPSLRRPRRSYLTPLSAASILLSRPIAFRSCLPAVLLSIAPTPVCSHLSAPSSSTQPSIAPSSAHSSIALASSIFDGCTYLEPQWKSRALPSQVRRSCLPL